MNPAAESKGDELVATPVVVIPSVSRIRGSRHTASVQMIAKKYFLQENSRLKTRVRGRSQAEASHGMGRGRASNNQGECFFLAGEEDGLHLVDVSHIRNPRQAGFFFSGNVLLLT